MRHLQANLFTHLDTSNGESETLYGSPADILSFFHVKILHRLHGQQGDFKSAISVANDLLSKLNPTSHPWVKQHDIDKEKSMKWLYQWDSRDSKFCKGMGGD
jgi:hypothetical protein